MPTTVNVTATNDGEVYCDSTVFATARNATTGAGTASTAYELYHSYVNPYYMVVRSFASFPINIGFNPTISSATLYLYGHTNTSTTDFNIYVVQGTQTGLIGTSWFNDFTGWVSGGVHTPTYYSGAWNTSSYSATWNTIDFNAAGLAAIMAANNSTLPICLLVKESDIDNVAPLDGSKVKFYSSSTAGKEPYLAITYTLPDISKSLSVTVEVDTAGTGTKKLAKSVAALVETETAGTGTKKLAKSMSSTVEMECVGTGHCGIYKALAAVLEMEAAATRGVGSTMRILLSKIIDLADKEVNDGVKVNKMIREIVTKFNRLYNTTYGHDHGGSDSKYISSTVSDIVLEDIAIMQLLDMYRRGG
jgi:hypothetical protein